MKINKSHVLSNCQHAGIIVNDELIYVHARSQIKQEILPYYTYCGKNASWLLLLWYMIDMC